MAARPRGISAPMAGTPTTTALRAPVVQRRRDADGRMVVALAGQWNLRGLSGELRVVRRTLRQLQRQNDLHWDLTAIDSLDSAGAAVLWECWGEEPPADLSARPEHQAVLSRVGRTAPEVPGRDRAWLNAWLTHIGLTAFSVAGHLRDALALIGQLALDMLSLIARRHRLPLREISATVHKAGTQALAITGLVGLLIGVVISYLSSMQLKLLGAERFIIDMVGFGVTRELGPLLTAILIAGRSGSAITAELGVMRLTEELDALVAMGIPPTLRLLLPKVIGLALALPLLVVWTNSAAILGGMLVARAELGIAFGQFFIELPGAIPLGTFLIALVKASAFGIVIALVACHYGMRIQPNSESLGRETTNAVVTAITLVILSNAMFAIALRGAGWHD